MVDDAEHFSRWIYNPRFINDAGEVNERFITLRSHLNETGISGQLYDRLTLDEVIETGEKFIRTNRKGEATERLSHLAKAHVGILRGLAIPDDIIDVLEVPSEAVPQHAEIQLALTDETNTAKTYYYFEKIKDELLKDVYPVPLKAK